MDTLLPDSQQLDRFIRCLFRYADPDTYVSLRAFHQTDRAAIPFSRAIAINGDLSKLTLAASRAIIDAGEGIVFAPPICTFTNPDRARSSDLANGLVLSVEIDDGDTSAARIRLESLLGPATVVVLSGGDWPDPVTGEVHPKRHIHWRLSEPTRAQSDHDKLRQARDLAARLVGADPTGKPVVHPLRWAGSWNVKAAPRLARIETENADAEINLDDALERLEEAVEAAGLAVAEMPRSGNPEAPLAVVASAMAAIPNDGDTHYDTWIRLGYAAWRATGGNGFSVWDDWSRKSEKNEVAERNIDAWNRIGRAINGSGAPRTIGAGTIFFHAGAAGWRRPEDEPPAWFDEAPPATAEYSNVVPLRGEAQPVPPKPTDPSVLWTIAEPWNEADIPVRPWIARGFLMRRALSVISGPPSAGKSSLMNAWACAMAIGSSFGRLKILNKLRVIVYNVEDDADEQMRRFSATLKRMGLSPADAMGNLLILGPSKVGTLLNVSRDGGFLINTAVLDRLEEIVVDFRPDVVLLDPFVELHQAEENDNTAIRGVLARFRAWAVDRDMALGILHHARKGVTTPGDPDSLRGASAIVGAARIALTLNVMTDVEARAFDIPLEKRLDYFRLDRAKSNYSPIEKAEWFERQEVKLENGGDDHEPDGVAVVWPWVPPNILAQQTAASLNALLDVIAKGPEPLVLYSLTRQGGSNRWVGMPIIQALDVNEQQAVEIIRKWQSTGLLTEGTFHHPKYRRELTGVIVDNTKRPTE